MNSHAMRDETDNKTAFEDSPNNVRPNQHRSHTPAPYNKANQYNDNFRSQDKERAVSSQPEKNLVKPPCIVDG